MIVAWHEVPGTLEQRHPKEPSRRVRYDCAGVRPDSKIRGEISNAVSLSRIEMIPKCIGGVLDNLRLLED